jgi:hypothetical protein
MPCSCVTCPGFGAWIVVRVSNAHGINAEQNAIQEPPVRFPNAPKVLIGGWQNSDFRTPGDFIRTSSFLPLRVVAWLDPCLRNSVQRSWPNLNRCAYLVGPIRTYYPISYYIRWLSQLLTAHHVSISLLQFQIVLSKLQADRGCLREFVHAKSSLRKTPLWPYCASIV